jgi:hypothetical protein
MTDIRRIDMRKIRDVLRLHLKGGLSQRQIAAGNRPLEPRALEVEFFPMEEVLHEKVKIH